MQVFRSWDNFLLWRKGEEGKYPQHDLGRFWGITPHNIRPTTLAVETPQAVKPAVTPSAGLDSRELRG